LLLGIGHLLRSRSILLQKLYLPCSIIAGLIGLAIIQTGNGLAGGLYDGDYLGGWEGYRDFWTAGWSSIPGKLINVVFACLFLGVMIPGIKKLWGRAAPQLAYGQVVAWGQYVVGIGLTLIMLTPLFGVHKIFGAIIPVGFEGGHGTAAGLKEEVFDEYWAEGYDFAMASATAGITSAIIVGMILVNWAIRRGYTYKKKKPSRLTAAELRGIYPQDQRPSAGKLTVSADAIETLTLQLVFIGVAILIGLGIQKLLALAGAGLAGYDGVAGSAGKVLKSFPLFPLAMMGGLLVQLYEQKYDKHKLIDTGLMKRIQGIALDFLVVAAIATIKISVLKSLWLPFVILIAAGILWNVFCVVVLARRLLPDAWFERSIAEMGQSMGVTATGLVLLRSVDGDYESPAADAFASKQLLHEPFMGGGLWTSAAIPLIAIYGGPVVFYIAVGGVSIWLIIAMLMKRKRMKLAAG